MLVPIRFFIGQTSISTMAMVDSGATGNFVHSTFVSRNKIPLKAKEIPIELFVIDGTPISSGNITHNTTSLEISVQPTSSHLEHLEFDVIAMKYNVILGLPWLIRHSPTIVWGDLSLEFKSPFCISQCLGSSRAAAPSRDPFTPWSANVAAPRTPALAVAASWPLPGASSGLSLRPGQGHSPHQASRKSPRVSRTRTRTTSVTLVGPSRPTIESASKHSNLGSKVSPSSILEDGAVKLTSLVSEVGADTLTSFVSEVRDVPPTSLVSKARNVLPASHVSKARGVPPTPFVSKVGNVSPTSLARKDRVIQLPSPASLDSPDSAYDSDSDSSDSCALHTPADTSGGEMITSFSKLKPPLAPISREKPVLFSTKDLPSLQARLFDQTLLETYLSASLECNSYLAGSFDGREDPYEGDLEDEGYVSGSDSDNTAVAVIPKQYVRFKDLFDKTKADVLPLHQPYDHKIPLETGTSPPYGPIYGLSAVELTALRKYLDENLARNFIKPSTSPAGAPILFVKKKDSSLRLCVDFRGINKVTIKNRYPLPLINELLDRVQEATIYTKLDLRGAYNLVRIAKGEEWKTAFRTRYGHFEYNVMPFGLANAPATFQALMHDVLRPFLDIFCVVYLDDILIYSKNELEHARHVTQVLEKLSESRLFVQLEKCKFHVNSVDFLGYVISPEGVSMDDSKVLSIASWPRPTSVKGIQAFLGFCNFYRIFIPDYSKLAAGLLLLVKKDTPFIWTEAQDASFVGLKKEFDEGKILIHFDPTKACFVFTDASDRAISGILYQKNEDDKLQPVAFFSRTLSSAEQNYDIFNKELLGVVASLKHWRIYLEGASHQITVFTDHSNLVPFTTTKELNRRHARWSEILSGYDFVIKHIPGTANSKADALSRRPDYMAAESSNLHPPVIRPSQLIMASLVSDSGHNTEEEPDDSDLEVDFETLNEPSESSETLSLSEQLRAATQTDAWARKALATLMLAKEPSSSKTLDSARNLENFSLNSDDLLMFNNRIFVPHDEPLRTRILRIFHDDLTAGHFGIAKTLEAVSRTFYWSKLRQFVEDYVKTCEKCSLNKSSRHKPYGELQPLPIPLRPWSSISMDFIVKLPPSVSELYEDTFDSILVVVDRLTKMAHFIACKEAMSAKQLALLLLKYVFRLHGLPLDIVSDRGSTFTSHFFRELTRLCKIRQKLSTAYHPQTDGQTEKTNSTLEQYLRMFVNYEQDNWVDLLPFAEFSFNNAVSASSLETPFFANFGFHPNWHLEDEFSSRNPVVEDNSAYLRALHKNLRDELLRAQDSQAHAFNRRVEASPPFGVGDMVWPNRRNIRTTHPSRKLDVKNMGPFQISRQVSKNAFELVLPHHMTIHNVFHVCLLEKVVTNGLRPTAPRPKEILLEDNQVPEYEVEAIRKHRAYKQRPTSYFVKWIGYPDFENTWESETDLENAPEILSLYKTKHHLD